MAANINGDLNRFKDLVKKKVGDNLHKFIGSDKIVAKHGNKIVNIPMKYINIPHFGFGGKNGGTGQGSGSVGDPVDSGNGKKGNGKGTEAGDDHEEHLSTEFTVSEIAEILKTKLELPNIEPRGTNRLNTDKSKYNKISNVGPNSLTHRKRTYKETIKRVSSIGNYTPGDFVAIEKSDRRYKDCSTTPKPETTCTLFFIRDISGSMGTQQVSLSRSISYWVDLLLRSTYGDAITTHWICFDTEASEIDRNSFFELEAGGGTRITSGIKLASDILEKEGGYNATNAYAYIFSDGDCHHSDTTEGVEAIHQFLGGLNSFCYGQVINGGGSDGEFMKTMRANFDNHEKVAMAQINNDEDILGAIKTFFTPKK